MLDEKIKSKLLKLYALATRGVGGEKDNAERFLKKMLAKNNITVDQLLDITSRKSFHLFTVKNKYELRLLVQIVCNVTNKQSAHVGFLKNKAEALLNDEEYIEVELLFYTHKKALAETLELAYHAYIERNAIFAPALNDPSENESRSFEDSQKLRAMMDGIDVTSVRTEIANHA